MKKLSPRQLRRMQARMLGNLGLDFKELGVATEVVIRLQDRELKIKNPAVTFMKIENESVYQILGGEVEETTPTVERIVEEVYTPSEEDVMLVATQAGVSGEEAKRALIETNGDLAKAILLLKSRKT
ncbi:MAG: nascent polypeptide-associated complex protein [Aigarchaeota archaeon]|nr:nascent polypeptide-associated complex protein [Aigarchaeota archaeon]MCX8192695.1 nascent polypeptide-associated complex protein [Nitrososphaeria archaeon]MDW7987005.1 nascent polypeptide-associated complex protein [Nitrososphaerota archaeon]